MFSANSFLLLLSAAALSAQSLQIQGRVYDALTGENLARVRVEAGGIVTATGDDGAFLLQGLTPGEHQLVTATVGYRASKTRFLLDQSLPRAFEIALQPDTLRHRETLDVTAGPYATEPVTAVGLAGNELSNLASVLADDPLRAIQALPGVTLNNDFQSQFSLRGAGFSRIGLYLDGVLLHAPFHSVQGDASSASLTTLEGDALESLHLFAGPVPIQFADRTAGAVAMRTREPDRERTAFRASASASNVSFFGEGPIDKKRRLSWLFGARKSYLQYLINSVSDEPALAFGYSDVQGKLSWQASPGHTLSLSLSDGRSGLDRTSARDRFGTNTIITSAYHFTLATLASHYAPKSNLILQSRVAFLRERFDNRNRQDRPLAGGGYGEWVAGTDAVWNWNEAASLEAGIMIRRLRDDGFFHRLLNPAPLLQVLDRFRGAGLRSGGYLHQSWAVASRRIRLGAGMRWDGHSVSSVQAVSPAASIGASLWPSANLQISWAQHAQYPEISQLFSRNGRRSLLPERAAHIQASLEQGLGARTRLRLELFNRQDRDLLFQPLFDPRILNARVFDPPLNPPWENSLRGYARGGQIFLQQRTSNGFTGWISYMYAHSRLRDGLLRLSFPSNFDQRHTVNVFGGYRLRPTVNLSVKYIYGSGFPVPGFFQGQPPTFFLATERNRLRLPHYSRADWRINKTWIGHRRQLTLFSEVINLLNRDNVRYEDLSGYDRRTASARLSFERTFPILPSAGILVEF